MQKNIRMFFVAMCGVGFLTPTWGANLNGATHVNVTSTTAAAAKKQALDQARRQIIFDTLSKYTATGVLWGAIDSADTETLENLIASSSINDERQSNTTYSANITMKLDQIAVNKWLDKNDIPNSLNSQTVIGHFDAVITLTKPVSQWHDIREAARMENIELPTTNIHGRNEITVSLPLSSRRAFINMLSHIGWGYENRGDNLYVFKK